MGMHLHLRTDFQILSERKVSTATFRYGHKGSVKHCNTPVDARSPGPPKGTEVEGTQAIIMSSWLEYPLDRAIVGTVMLRFFYQGIKRKYRDRREYAEMTLRWHIAIPAQPSQANDSRYVALHR